MRRSLLITMWLTVFACASCGVKGPPLPPETAVVDVSSGTVPEQQPPRVYGPKNRNE